MTSWGLAIPTCSEAAFFEVLELLKPQLVVILGYELWDNVGVGNGTQGPKLPAVKDDNTWRYFYPGGSCLAVCLKHPSSGFNGRKWNSYILKAIELA